MKTYLFDFDGTLVDSMPSFVNGMLKILDENNVKYGDDLIKIITPLGLNGTADYFINELGLNITKSKLLEQMQKNIIDEYFYKIPAKNNVVKVLNALKNQGASLNVLTASPHITLDACLKRVGLYDLFDNVWSCDDFFTTKANPEIYLKVAEKLGVNISDVLFLDDNINADKTAKQAGMKVCGVFDPSSKDGVQEMQSVCDYYVFDMIELLEIDF